ncbi:type IX secretion system outer membrane channel protein PorV [Massilibacteroides sp.]|uniref:type IX secretion system outer membrane channel protein PorV n=1 Tax=Massilibacteroides sp. TaxID=2034766 RepID=UPI00261A508A|nr:type IX secretion system outer membrane channel protein PorV [Massilibacteroides sp.]MDD4516177.1 type IX secretion system outer membrane channel protein PorV [Massilibacteroides sp.]
MVSLMSLTYIPVTAQDKKEFAPINTAVPSLSIAPDARGGGMGDNGVSTLPDENSQYWNPAKYAFMTSKAGVALSYTPWLRKLVNDVALANLAGYYKIGDNDLQAIGASLRYFSLGDVPTGEYQGNSTTPQTYINPYEMALDVSYSRKLSEYYSMAVALRYIRSDMSSKETEEQTAGNAFAADVAGYLEKYVIMGNAEALWSLGFNVSNIGTKISYDGGETNQFIPTTLRLGTGLLYPLDEYNRIGFYLDLSKYLVPTLPKSEGSTAEEQEHYEELKKKYNDMSGISGMVRSFSDAPGGFSEELQEVNVSIGAEYSYNEQFFIRGGYYYENPNKGNRQYFSIGTGFRMSVFQLDAAYLISTVQSNPLDQTLRFSLSFDMDGLKGLVR